MGSPEEYDWGIKPEVLEQMRADMSVSVALTLDRETMETIDRANAKEIS